MRIRVALVAALFGLLAAALPSLATTPPPRVEWHTSTAVHGDLGPVVGAPATWATRAAHRWLGVDDLRVERVRTSLIGTHVRGRQYRGALPIDRTDWVVSAVGGRVVGVDARPSTLPGAPVARPVPPAVARAAAAARLGVRTTVVPPAVSRMLVPGNGRLVDVYRIAVLSTAPAVAATVDVDAATGRVLAVRSDARRVDGSTKVFDPNPIVTSRDPSLRQPLETGLPADADLDSDALTAQRRTLPLLSLNEGALAVGRLSGPHVNILGGGYTASAGAGAFDVTRSDPRFEGLMAYAHLDRYQRYLQGLGFRGAAAVHAEPLDVLAGGVQGFDNSFYYPYGDVVVYGSGGVDDAEDAEIVLHEYGHAVQEAQVSGFGYTPESGAMGEGFGDFQAAAYYARTSGGFGDACLAEWDATSLAKGLQTCLRRLDGTKNYPADITGEVHADGEIWSAFLWQVRAGLPGTAGQKSDASLRLVISSHELLGSEATFAEGVAAVRQTARALGHPEWVRLIERAATDRGLPLKPAF